MIRERLLNIGLLWLRVLMGFGISLLHGYGKVFGGRMEQFTEAVTKMGFPLPGFFAWSAALSEFAGGLLIALGLGTRIAAFFVFITMSVAAFVRHADDPINVKELSLAYWTVSAAILLMGPGRFSIDNWLTRFFCKSKQ